MPAGTKFRRMAVVTFGTDGFVDYVQMSDGQKFTLGSVSVLRLISSLVPLRSMRTALDTFLADKQVMLSVDLDKMWDLLPFQRARYSSVSGTHMGTTNPLMYTPDRSSRETDMLKTASYDTFTSNVELAEDIVAKVAATDEAIERLVTAGKRFDSVRAKADLHRIASRVTEISQNVDFAQPWVGNDLSDLSKKANEIHELFDVNG